MMSVFESGDFDDDGLLGRDALDVADDIADEAVKQARAGRYELASMLCEAGAHICNLYVELEDEAQAHAEDDGRFW